MKIIRVLSTVALALGLTLVLLGLLGGALVARAATFTVTRFDDPTPDGCNVGDCSLREAIIAANATPEQDTISLPAGTYVLSIAGTSENAAATGDLDITTPLQIVGAGSATTIVDGGDIDRVFHVQSSNVSLLGLTVRNGNVTSSGGGIYAAASLQLTDVIVVDNVSGAYGGGISIAGQDNSTLQDTQVLSNTALRGGGIYFSSDTNVLLTLRGDSVIAYNRANGTGFDGRGGGVNVSQGGKVALEAGQIISNTANWFGGGLYLNSSNATLGSVEISGNIADTYGGGVYIRSGNVTVSGTQVISNTANESGGGIYVEMTSAVLTMTAGSVIADNWADWQGGGLFIQGGQAALFNGQVISNSAGTSGGGIFIDTTDAFFTQAEGSLIAYNHAAGTALGQGGGGLYVNSGSALLQGGQILDNDATSGGGVYIRGATAVLTQTDTSVISLNTAATAGGGVYVDYDGARATLSGGEILSNTVSNGNGGGLYIASGSAMLNNGQIQGNYARAGGGVYVYNATAVFTQTGVSTISNNNSSNYGGGLEIYQGRASLEGGAICDNQSGSGGGFYIYQGQVDLNGVIICDNQASFSGGGIHHRDGNLTLVNTTVSGNQASNVSSQGGGIYLSGGTAALTYTTFTSNTAASGDGIYRHAGTALLHNTIVAYNGAVNCNTGLTSNGYNLDSGATCGLSETSDQQNTNPLLGLLADNGGDTLTHELLDGSPAIDSGFCVAGIEVDQRNVARPYGYGCDIGAYEVKRFNIYLPLLIR